MLAAPAGARVAVDLSASGEGAGVPAGPPGPAPVFGWGGGSAGGLTGAATGGASSSGIAREAGAGSLTVERRVPATAMQAPCRLLVL